MTFDTYFRITSYGLVGTAFAALSLTKELDLVSIVLYSIAFIVSFRADTRARTRLRLREWMWRVLALAYVPFLFIDGMMTSRITALVHMTLFLSAAKLFQDKRDRDWVFLYLIAFFQMLLAAGQTFDSTFIVSLGFFVFFFVSTLAAFEIRISRREVNPLDEEIVSRAKKPRLLKGRRKQPATASDRPRASSPLAGRVRYLVGASFTQVLLVGILTLPFFFLIPRFGGGMTRGLRDVDTLTGFSDSVKLGEVARIKESQKVVMRVRLDHKPARYVRWRGIALDRYSGDSWTKTGTRWIKQSSGRINHGNAAEVEEFESDYKVGDWSESRDPLEQKIVLEPSSSATQTLFAAKSLVRLHGVLPEVSKDTRSGAVAAAGIKGRIQYTAVSDLSGPDEQRLLLDSSTSYPAEIKNSCLQVPGDGEQEVRLDPRIKQLALEKTRGARTPYEKARAIETYLKTQFGYTLDLNFTRRDPLAEFLFDAKAGHCGYFATAMAVMMRLLDIPARIVNGFQMGDYNDINGLYTVRASDAHTWVEVYFGDSAAWVEFDPTPAAGINDYSQDGFLARLKKYLEAAEVFWLDYVVTLDQEEQASMMVELQHQLLSIKDQALDSYGSVKRWVRGAANSLLDREWDLEDILKGLGLVAVLVAVTAGIYVTLAYLKRRRRAPTGYGPWWHRLFILPRWSSARLAVRDPRTSAVLFYEQMLAITARAGLIKRPDETPIEFAAGAEFPQVHEITVIYNRLRFGGIRLEEGEAARVSRLLADLKRETRWEIRRKKGKEKQKDSSP